ncbi:uncharacterized protein LOC115033555 [Acyrthosiphon pisum]|uniref:ATP-dependent DNA helicase n=2 Tax=Acyrthosiphon pisum TaxID=7029 RepID=A0A8R2JMM0_ACYPI|nr:uncharacterized protein LOC115033555 [Acyrthosiphon pisum]
MGRYKKYIKNVLEPWPSEPLKLWDNFKDDLCEDIKHRIRQQNQDLALPYSEDIYNEGLIQIENKLLQLNDKSLSHFGLPSSVRTENNATYTMAHHYNTNDLTSFVNENLIKPIITGPAAGQLAHIPRIPMIPTDLPNPFKRIQFLVKISFTLTINKPQGQTFELVGIDLRKECFTHGQLYVGLSRVGSADNQFILLPQNKTTSNIVYREALTQ